MEIMNGELHQKNILSQSLTKRSAITAEYLLLIGIGMIAITLHARFRMGFNIPGHHGITFMTMMIMGRSISKMPWASTISAIGVGALLFVPILGFKDPFMAMVFILPGFMLDLLYGSFQKVSNKAWFIALSAGIAYMMIPLIRMVINLTTGFPYFTFVKHGYFIPVLTHLIFGLIGGLTGTGLYFLIKKLLKK